jgi:hypothetical protein
LCESLVKIGETKAKIALMKEEVKKRIALLKGFTSISDANPPPDPRSTNAL